MALVVVVVVFQLLLYSPGAPNAAVQLGAYLSQESSSGKTGRAKKKAEEERIRFTTAARMVLATMAGAMVGSVFARVSSFSWLTSSRDLVRNFARPDRALFNREATCARSSAFVL